MRLRQLLALLFVASPSIAFSKEFSAQGRIFAGVSDFKPDGLNQELTAESLQTFSTIARFGAEITFPVVKFLEVGMGYSRRGLDREEANGSLLTDYRASLVQHVGTLVARVPFLKTSLIRADVFGAFGGSNTSLKLKTATQDGELSRKNTEEFFATPFYAYGASVGVGYKSFFIYVEGGVETNKVNSLNRSGTLTSSVSSLDLSGPYVSLGLMFDGVKASSR